MRFYVYRPDGILKLLACFVKGFLDSPATDLSPIILKFSYKLPTPFSLNLNLMSLDFSKNSYTFDNPYEGC